jgi:hypothetical protein
LNINRTGGKFKQGEHMSGKKVRYSSKGIGELPKDKPVLYKILTEAGNPNYVGVAHRGRAQERLLEHIGEIPGASVSVKQFGSIADARKEEAKVIKREQPKYIEKGK